MKIALIGECMIELSGEPFGLMKQGYGGDSLNSAIYLARAAADNSYEVSYVTAMGEDAMSKAIIKQWQDQSINTNLVITDPARQPGLYMIQLDAQGERSFLYWRDNSAAKYMIQNSQFEEIVGGLSQMDVIYLSGISLAILPEQDCQALIEVLAQLSEQGKKIVFDSNHRPALWANKGGVEQAKIIYNQVLAFSELALVTDDDEQTLWGDKDYLATIERLKKIGVTQIVVKRGADGCNYTKQGTDELTHIPIEKSVKVVDTTSAGDSFNAGYLSGLLRGWSPTDCARFGNAMAGEVIQHKGAIIDRKHIDKVISEFN